MCAAGIEINGSHLLAFAAEKMPQCPERCGGNFGDQIDHGLPDDMAVSEFRIVYIAADRHLDIDFAFSVRKQRNGQIQRQIDRIGRFDALT